MAQRATHYGAHWDGPTVGLQHSKNSVQRVISALGQSFGSRTFNRYNRRALRTHVAFVACGNLNLKSAAVASDISAFAEKAIV